MTVFLPKASHPIAGSNGLPDPVHFRWMFNVTKRLNEIEVPDAAAPASETKYMQGAGIAITGTDIKMIGLDTLEDSGAGTFKLLDRDAYGRLAGTADGAAADVPYDNATSGLAATDVQGAIDEVAGMVVGAGAWVTIPKLTDETRSATTTLANDATLKFTAPGAGKYLIRLTCIYSIANPTMDFKVDVGFSGTGAVTGTREYFAAGNATATGGMVVSHLGPFTAIASSAATSADIGFYRFTGVLNASTGGTAAFQWAQNTSDAGNCVVRAGSYLEYIAL